MTETLKDLKREVAEWSGWWVFMWIVLSIGLLAAAPFLGFWHWWTAVFFGFGVPETVGTIKQDDAYPPLTHVIVRYVPSEIALPLLFGFAGGIGAFWFGFNHPGRLGLLVGFIGWLNAHFLLRYVRR